MRPMLHFLRPFSFLLMLLSLSACAAQPLEVELKGEVYTVDLALTAAEQRRGLMFVRSMPADHGMLFVFPREAPRSFWMKNTRIPLDILYFDAELQLVSVARARPCVAAPCPAYPSKGPARYVLELNAGQAEKLNLAPGDLLQLRFDLN